MGEAVKREDFSNVGNARIILAEFVKDHRYAVGLGWMQWNGVQWVLDPDGKEAEAKVKKLAPAAVDLLLQNDIADDIEKAGRRNFYALHQVANIKAVTQALTLFNEVRIPAGKFDSVLGVINCQNGVYDLDAQKFIPHKSGKTRDYLCRHVTGCEYDPKAECPQWNKFLEYSLSPEMESYVRQVIGLCLTGRIDTEKFWFVFGIPGTGKSRFLETLAQLFGDYGGHINASTLCANTKPAIPTEIADLHGKRFVHSTEVNVRMQLDEALLCDLAGNDTLTARQLYQPNFKFMPTHRLFLRGNSKPQIKDIDSGLWRRLKFIEFQKSLIDAPAELIPKVEEGEVLKELLLAELSGILNWAIDGYKIVQRIPRIIDPVEATAPTEEYKKQSDLIGLWAEENLVCDKEDRRMFTGKKELYDNYQAWGEEQGINYTLSKVQLLRTLKDRGFEDGREGHTGKRVVYGLRIKDESEKANDVYEERYR